VATDFAQIVSNLATFYDVTGKEVVAIGVGGGRLVDYLACAAHTVAVDRDREALDRLAEQIRNRDLDARFDLIASDALEVRAHGDVVYFEFCLHQMASPDRVLDHAAALAPELLVVDHAAGSPWSWCAAEDRLVESAWAAVEGRSIRRERRFDAVQRFERWDDLAARLAGQPPACKERIERYRTTSPVEIPMPYRMALL
jgi:hypothetical protein